MPHSSNNHSLPRIEWQNFQPQPVIGIDEAGRGCLAGPVFASAVILTANKYYPDSKTISAKKREQLAREIMNESLYAVGTADVHEINQLNILQASLLSMRRAVLQLNASMGHLLIDGPWTLPNISNTFRQTPLIKGDQRASPISAAGIIAKVKRDEWMRTQDKLYPQYGFAKHKGYAVLQHKQALKIYGPCKLHRRDFLKNTPPKITKGKMFEQKAIQFFKQKGWDLFGQNQKWAGVEIDLILKNKTGWLLVEVKSNNSWRRDHPLSFQQKARLQKAFAYFCEQHKEPVQIQLAIVSPQHIHTFSLEEAGLA